jgi:hypothetical protein
MFLLSLFPKKKKKKKKKKKDPDSNRTLPLGRLNRSVDSLIERMRQEEIQNRPPSITLSEPNKKHKKNKSIANQSGKPSSPYLTRFTRFLKFGRSSSNENLLDHNGGELSLKHRISSENDIAAKAAALAAYNNSGGALKKKCHSTEELQAELLFHHQSSRNQPQVHYEQRYFTDDVLYPAVDWIRDSCDPMLNYWSPHFKNTVHIIAEDEDREFKKILSYRGYYERHFVGRPHYNFLGFFDDVGVVVISILCEPLHDGSGTHSRIILRTSEVIHSFLIHLIHLIILYNN